MSGQQPVAVAGGTEPYVVKERQEGLSQLQGDGAGYRGTTVQEQIAEDDDGHPNHVAVIFLQELHEAFGQAPHSFGLCGTQGCATPPCCCRAQRPKAYPEELGQLNREAGELGTAASVPEAQPSPSDCVPQPHAASAASAAAPFSPSRDPC